MIKRLITKACSSKCSTKIAAIAFTRKNNILGISFNTRRFIRSGGGLHAERKLMDKYGRKIFKIIICRVGKGGALLPIEPCKTCKKIADKLGIKIESV